MSVFGTGRERLAILGTAEDPQALALLTPTRQGAWQTWQPANAPLGFWLMKPGLDWASILRSLMKALPGWPLLVGVSQQDPALLARPEDGASLSTLDYIVTARVDLRNLTYQDYWRQRGKNLRHNIKRQFNRLEREEVRTRLDAVTTAADMTQAVQDYALLETRGWKGTIESAVTPEGGQARFYANMLKAFADADEAVVYRFFYDDHLVATDLCLCRDGCLIILKTTYDESSHGTSPAHLMRHEIVRDALETGRYRTIEFYGPAQDWHRRWTEDMRTLYHVNVYRWPFLAAPYRWRGALRQHPTS